MEQLEFKIDGPVLKHGVNLPVAIDALNNFQSILDKTFLVATNSKRMTAGDRENFYIKVSEFKQGSLLVVFDIALRGVQLGIPFFSTIGPQNFWDITAETFDFLKVVCAAVQRGEKPQYRFDNNGDAIVTIDNSVRHYHGPVYNIAQLALPSYQSLAHLLHPRKVSEISAGREGAPKRGIYIGEGDRDAFEIPTHFEKETIELKCEIFDFNKHKNAGKLAVTAENQKIPPGDYSFSIFGAQDNVDYIYSMLRPEVTLHCLVEIASDPFGEDKVHALHVTAVG